MSAIGVRRVMIARAVPVTFYASGEADPTTVRRTNFGPFFWEIQEATTREDLREGGRFSDVSAIAMVPEQEAARLAVKDLAIMGGVEFVIGFIGAVQASGFCEVAMVKPVPK